MGRRALIAGNWKMNGSLDTVRALLKGIKSHCQQVELAELAIFPPSVFIPECQTELVQTQVSWGAQDISPQHSEGAFTGDLLGGMLTDFGCRYVIVGHSERRQYHHETNQLVAEKCFAALMVGLKPIVCVGETEKQRNDNQTHKIITDQLAAVLEMKDNPARLENMVVAYEPVWAIGTGNQASPEQAQAVHEAIRSQLNQFDADLAQQVRIIYGGSVKASNAAALFEMSDVDGALVGGASLDAEQFIEIAKQWNR